MQPVEERRAQLGAARRPEADRVGIALVEGHAVVLDPRRQVKQVAGMRDVFFLYDAPPAPAWPLQQEHVVGVDVRPDAAAGRRIAHHHVVEARLRNEREAPQQRVGGAQVQVHAGDEQRRARLLEGNLFKRPMARIPEGAAAFHHPGFDIVARRQRSERALVDHAAESRQRLRHEKRALLPITTQKRAWRKSSQQLQSHRGGNYM